MGVWYLLGNLKAKEVRKKRENGWGKGKWLALMEVHTGGNE